jgi:hypothetical protein
MVIEPRIARVLTHHWLRYSADCVFHCYVNERAGSPSMCGDGEPVGNVRNMDLPGDRTKICPECVKALYGPAAMGELVDEREPR